MDPQKKEVIVQMLFWWLQMSHTMRKCLFLSCIALTLHRNLEDDVENEGDPQQQPNYDTEASDLLSTAKSEPTYSSRKRRRTSGERDEFLAKLIQEVYEMESDFQQATDNLCSEVLQLAHETAMDEMAGKLFEDPLEGSRSELP